MSISIVTNEDNIDFMARYPDKYFELAICDPPYGIGAANMKMGLGTGKNCSKAKNRKWVNKDWDKNPPRAEYFNELIRVSKNQIVWGGNYFAMPPTQGFIIWDKQIDEQLFFSQCEFAWTSFQRAAKICKISVYKTNENKINPCQKPVALYKWILKNYAKEGDKILDTHLGSGSSRIAAYELGFDFYATELDTEYFNEANKRFKTESMQKTMFTFNEQTENKNELF